MGAEYHILQNKHAVLQEQLWELVQKWQDEARDFTPGPYLCKTPVLAYRQAMGSLADELQDVLLDFGDDDAVGVSSGIEKP